MKILLIIAIAFSVSACAYHPSYDRATENRVVKEYDRLRRERIRRERVIEATVVIDGEVHKVKVY